MTMSFTHLQWTARDVRRLVPDSIINHGPLKETGGATKIQILKNERLQSLMNRPRNRIVALPDQRAVARFFYCGSCGKIPFPLTKDRKNKAVAHLCKNGHPVCHTCYKSYYACLFSPEDYVRVYDTPPTTEALERHTKPRNTPLGNWGQIRLCSATFSKFKCGLLRAMILFTEFACKNYYNWCAFRGRGGPLRDHEAKCKYRFPVSSRSAIVACISDPKSGKGSHQTSKKKSKRIEGKKSEGGSQQTSKKKSEGIKGKKSEGGSQQTSKKKSEGSQQTSKKKSEGSLQTSKKKSEGSQHTSKKKSEGSQHTSKKKSEGSKQTSKKKSEEGSQHTSTKKTEGIEGKKSEGGSQQTSTMKSESGSQQTAKKKSEGGSQQTSKKKSGGSQQTSKKKSGGSQQTSKKKSGGSQQTLKGKISKKKLEEIDPNAAAILHFNLYKARKKIRELVFKLKKEHGSKVEIPACLLRPAPDFLFKPKR